MKVKESVVRTALVAGASEGIGEAFARELAGAGMNLILIGRRQEPLDRLSAELVKQHGIEVTCVSCDLSKPDAVQYILDSIQSREIAVLVYNAAWSRIGAFETTGVGDNVVLAQTNMISMMELVQALGGKMLERGDGKIILMSSLAGFQGSGFLSTYAASKAFIRVFAESLWYEWKDRGVDVIACCAGATATPNYINTKPERTSMFAPKVQSPEAVVKECFKRIGRKPSFVTGGGNKFASFIMQRLMPRRMAIRIMGDTTKRMYRL